MPFDAAKKYVKAKVGPTIEKKEVQMNAAYEVLLEKFDDHTKKAAKYMALADYPGHNKDRLDYLLQIRKSTEGYLKKKGKLGEFLKYIVKVDKRSDKLHETFKENIQKREQAKFKELSEKNNKLTKEAKFDDAINNMLALSMHLSPFSRTDQSGNISETFLRLDKQIVEKLNNLKTQKKLYTQLFRKGNVFETKDAKIYISGASDGKVKFVDIKGKSLKDVKPNEYREVSWLALLRKFPLGTFELKRGGKALDIKIDPEVAKSSAEIAELKLLKQINFFYSGGLEKLAKSPEEKKLLKAALAENLQRLSLYFDRDAQGNVVPTKIYKMLPQSMKVKRLTSMMQGFQQIRMRMRIEGLLKEELGKGDEKDPSKVRFFKAEIDYQNGLYLSAYSKFKKYIKDNKSSKDPMLQKNVKLARARLRQSSFYVITLAQRYSLACINEPTGDKSKFHMREGFRKKVAKKLNKVFDELRRMMQTGEAKDLDDAYSKLKDKPEGGLDVKVGEFGAKGLTETNFLRKHYSFVKSMITTITFLAHNENQEDGLHHFAKVARKDKFRGAARVLLEEQMKRKLIMRKRELMKDPKFRAKNREQFLALTNADKNTLGFEKVVGMMASDLAKKYPNLAKGAKLAGKGLDAATDFVTDLFSDKVSLSKVLGEVKSEKGLSKYEDYSQVFSSSAGIMRRAIEEAGGFKKYQALPLAKKKEFYESARMKILLAQHQNSSHTSNVKGYIKDVMAGEGDMAKRTNSVAYDYNDAFDPNNEFFNLSDEGWDFVESLVGEVPIMAASAGAGNLASIAVKQGAKRLAMRMAAKQVLTKTLESAAFRLGVRGTAFVADLAVSEVVDRGMRYILKGEAPPMDISQLLAHSIGTYGSMKYASKAGQKLFGRMAEQGMAGKIASHAISTAAIEAPCMVVVNNVFGQADGPLLEQYGRALGTMLASKGSMSLLSASAGGAMMRAEQNYDVRESVHKMKDPWKKKILSDMIRKNEINTDQLATLMQSNLNLAQLDKIRNLLNNPKSVKFVVAYEYAKSHGIDNQDLTHQYNYILAQMVEGGLSRKASKKILEEVNERSIAKDASVSAATAAEVPAAKAKRLSGKSEKIKATPADEVPQAKLNELGARLKRIGMEKLSRAISDPNFFTLPWEDTHIAFYEQRVAEVKRLEALDSQIKADTKILRENGLVKEANELENYDTSKKYKTLDQRRQVAEDLVERIKNPNKASGSRPTAADLPGAKPKPSVSGSEPTVKPGLKESSGKSEKLKGTPVAKVDQAKLDALGERLKKIGMEDMGYAIAEKTVEIMKGSRNDIRTYEQRVAEVRRLEILHKQIKADTKILRENGLVKEANELEDYNKRIKYITVEQRQTYAEYLADGISNLKELKIPFQPENAVKIIDFVNAKSDAGKSFQRMVKELVKAKYLNDDASIRMLDIEIKRILIQTIVDVPLGLEAKLVERRSNKLLKPEDREILEANKGHITPELLDAIISGGQEVTAGGKTVRLYKGGKIGAGGLGAVHEVWFVQKPSNKLERGVVKIPHEATESGVKDTRLYFKYESDTATNLSKTFNKDKSEAADHVIKPIFSSPDVIIYKKIEVNGKSQSLHVAMETMTTKEWLKQFVGGLEGLAYLHKNGITHNDFKPDNIVVGKNGGVLIDIGSFVFKEDVKAAKVISVKDQESGQRLAVFKSGQGQGTVAFTLAFHDPRILAKSISSQKTLKKLPLNLGDKYAVGTSLLEMLRQKGFVTKKGAPLNYKFELKSDAPVSVKKLYDLGIQLMNAQNHPFKYHRKGLKKVRDPEYISIQGAIKKINQIAATLPNTETGQAAPVRSDTPTLKQPT